MNTPKTSLMFMSFITMLLIFPTMNLSMTNTSTFIEWEITVLSTCPITFPLIMDPVGMLFSLIVCVISSSVLMFSLSYMNNDPTKSRFTMMVILFVASMNLLIYIPNLITLLLGWDGLGVTSFALVIYYQNKKSLSAGMLTVMSNRIGDITILLAIAMTLNQGHWNIMSMWQNPMSLYITLCILIAAMTKSAQIPFSAWLPAAMAAPTPVSALVHSSTLVTAGVFILIRFFYFLSQNDLFTKSLLFISIFTTLMAGMAANMENDLKKIIALSTLSQLGVMMTSLALSLPLLALFHLLTHALFKALLFIAAGTIIHSNSNNQDIRKMGNLWSQLPITCIHLNIANLSLCGAPFLSGFYSKDIILENLLFKGMNTFIISIMILATGLTSAYSLRLSLMTLTDHMKNPSLHQNSNESNQSSAPMSFLSIFALMFGYLIQKSHMIFYSNILLPSMYKSIISLIIIMGLWMGYYIFLLAKNPTKNSPLIMFLASMWFMPDISSQGTMTISVKHLKTFSKSLDQGWVETGMSQIIHNSTKKMIMINYQILSSTINMFPILLMTTVLITMIYM
uniref:NADH-ubiquinone oxidoreductase chain 5 n=1 Tax=Neolepetopsis sp. TaxID=3071115 RepID=A0AA96HTS3_9GAST|nr:NADH dehydrogenase subunit 5 [Neolepetopsis sp.]